MEALYKLGKEHQVITDMAKDFERRRCNHRTAIEEIDCIKDVVGEYHGLSFIPPYLTDATLDRRAYEQASIYHGCTVIATPSTLTGRSRCACHPFQRTRRDGDGDALRRYPQAERSGMFSWTLLTSETALADKCVT